MSQILIRDMTAADRDPVLEIYAQGIDTGHATFEQQVPSWVEWDGAHLPKCRLIAVVDGRQCGWAALAGFSVRPVYRGVAELSLYVGADFRLRGVGSSLMTAVIAASEAEGFWTLSAGIFPENVASLELHKRHGFRELGRRRRAGKMCSGPMAGEWRDVLLLERRSTTVGL